MEREINVTMNKDPLTKRMEGYEAEYSAVYQHKLPLILRLEGINFSNQLEKWGCEMPFDKRIYDAMANTSKYLCERVGTSVLAYSNWDEIVILLRDDLKENTQPWHGKKVDKIVSVLASKATVAFNYYFHKDPVPDIFHLAEFTCRGYVIPRHEIANTFIWRQFKYINKSVQIMANSHFSSEDTYKKSITELKSMLLDIDRDWDALPAQFKYGTCVIQKQFEEGVPKVDSRGKIIEPGKIDYRHRKNWEIDNHIPIFANNKDYLR